MAVLSGWLVIIGICLFIAYASWAICRMGADD